MDENYRTPASTLVPIEPQGLRRRWHTYVICALLGIWGAGTLVIVIRMIRSTANFFQVVPPLTAVLSISLPMLMLYGCISLFFLERKAIVLNGLTPLLFVATLIRLNPDAFDLSRTPLLPSVLARLPDGTLLTIGFFVAVFLYSLRNRRRI